MAVILAAILARGDLCESIAPNQFWPNRVCDPGKIAPDFGEAIGEERQFREFWLMKG